MHKLFLIARWEYMTRIRSKWFIISTLIIPLVLVAFMFLPALVMQDTGTDTKILALIDASGEMSAEFEAAISEQYHLKNGQAKYQIIVLENQPVEEALAVGQELLDSQTIDAVVVLPIDIMGKNHAEYYANFIGNYREQEEVRAVISSVLMNRRARDAGLNPEMVSKLTRRVNLDLIEIGRGGEKQQGNEILSFILPIIFVMMLYFAIVMSSQVLMRSVLEERSNRLVEILLSSVSATQLMSGKILGLGLLGLTQLFFYMVCGFAVSQYRGIEIISSVQILYFLLYFILGYMFFSGVYAAIGAVFSSEQDAQQAVSIISIVSIFPLLMSSYVITNPDSLLTIILSHMPFVSPFFMILIIGIKTPSCWHIISTSFLLILYAVFAMIIAGKIFRTAILMTGKRPTLPEIMQWLKSA
ncbi:ABC transporter permease [bacterium]|nr:ABC transporter permease [bacterium]MBU1064023.1 ABC transporter permease [bacterium]MBU1875206.1 ABC transporter permease [bacterium]